MAQSEWAYEMSNEEILKEFRRACAQSGTANRGLVIDVMGPAYAKEVRYLNGVLLAKLEGIKPPFKRNDTVKVKPDGEVRPADWWGQPLLRDQKQIISRIHYDGNGKWLLEFQDIPREQEGYPQFNANGFILASKAKKRKGVTK